MRRELDLDISSAGLQTAKATRAGLRSRGALLACHAFGPSVSKSQTSSATTDNQAAAQDNARVQTGSGNTQQSDGSVSLTGSQINSGPKIDTVTSGGTVNITTNADELAARFADTVANISSKSNELLGQTITAQSDLAKKELATFTEATQAVKTGLSNTTIALVSLGAVGLVGLYIWKKVK